MGGHGLKLCRNITPPCQGPVKHGTLQWLTSRVKDWPAFIVAPFPAVPQRVPLPKHDLAVTMAPFEVTFGAPKVTALLPAVREMMKLRVLVLKKSVYV